MANILIVLTAVLFVGYHYSSALPALSLSDMPFSSGEPIPIVDPKCNAAIEVAVEKCNQTTQAKWKNVYQEMIEAKEKGDKAKFEHLELELTCCEVWDMIPCTEEGIKNHCSTEDYKKVVLLIEWAKHELDSKKCQAYPFAERANKCKPI